MTNRVWHFWFRNQNVKVKSVTFLVSIPVSKLKCHSVHWAWIFNSENKIEKREKLKLMRKLVYSRTNEEFNNELQTMRSSQTFLKYENYAQHINEKILPRRDEWSLLFRIESQLPTNNVNTSNYAEVSFRVTKDLKFNRHRNPTSWNCWPLSVMTQLTTPNAAFWCCKQYLDKQTY